MLDGQCKLIGYGEHFETSTLVTGATQEYCEELAIHWIKNHPERYQEYKIFVWKGFWQATIWYERMTKGMFQKYEIKETIFV